MYNYNEENCCNSAPVMDKPYGLSDHMREMIVLTNDCQNMVGGIRCFLFGNDPQTGAAMEKEPVCFAHSVEMLHKQLEVLAKNLATLREELR